MKKLYFFLTTFFTVNYCFAQTNTFPASGNVGIGTTSPGTVLEVRQPVLSGGDVNRNLTLFTDLYNNGSNGQHLSITSLANSGNHSGWNLSSDYNDRLSFGVFSENYNSSPNEYLSIVSSGNIGIGTITPSHKLDIVGDGINLENTTYTNQHGIIFKNGTRFIFDFNYGNNGTVTTAGGNTFVGVNAGNFTMGSTATNSSQASYNTVVGYEALYSNTTGYANTANGYETLFHNSAGFHNTANGYAALGNNTTGSYNTAIGSEALIQNTAGSSNTAIGFATLYENAVGVNNTAIGFIALEQDKTGNNNTAIGYESLYSDTTGSNNTAEGAEALLYNSSGTNNAASGYTALIENTAGAYNTAYGSESLYNTTTGNDNSAVGFAALDGNTAGSYNTANGYEAGLYASGSTANNASGASVFIGASSEALTASDNNEIVIGYSAIGAGSNSVVLGNTSIAKTLLQGNVLIGKTSQTNSSYKLDVNGNIRANQVTVNATGADYVFDPTYHVRSIVSLNNYINEYHHLPGVASAKKMQEEGNNIGATQMKMLKNEEEMALYVISMNKKVQELENQVKQLNAQMKKLKSKRP